MAKKKRKPDKNKQRIRQTRTEAGISRNSYDELVRQKFKQSIRNLKSRNLPEPEVYDGLDFDSNRQKRRVQAISRMLDTVKERIKEICPDVPGHFSIEEEWAEINSFPIPAYDFEERFTYSVVGAVIWMLDQIKEADRMDELLYLIKPVDDKVIFNVPPIWDPCHSNDVIYSMVDAVLGRNDPEDRSGFWPGEIRRPYMKPKFPDVRFIDRDMLPNPDLIRHADVVWIQTNALAHKYFYRIIEEVRKHNILLRYFSYSGVAKCAEQIVKEDRKHS